jgi:hypothetical protein
VFLLVVNGIRTKACRSVLDGQMRVGLMSSVGPSVELAKSRARMSELIVQKKANL